MRIGPRWLALTVLALTALGSLFGCKSEEDKKADAVISDVESMLDTAQAEDVSDMDFSGVMTSDVGKRLQPLLLEAHENEMAFAKQLEKWKPDEYSTGLALSDQKKRDEFRNMITDFKSALKQYSAETYKFWDDVYVVVKDEDGDDAPDPNARLRVGMKGLVRAFDEYSDAHLAVVRHCDKTKPSVGLDGLVEFKKSSDEDKYLELSFAAAEAKTRLGETATVFEQMRQSQMNAAEDMLKSSKGN